MREVFLGQRIAHPNVGASLLLPDGRQTQLYVAMPYYKGETLEDRLRRGPMKVDEAVAIAIKAARGLTSLHRAGITHRDVKPQNIMLLENGDVKLIDLGISRLPRIEDADEAGTPGTLDSHNVMYDIMGCRDDPKSPRGETNLGGYCNKQFDALTDQVLQETDTAKRDQLIKSAFEIGIKDWGYIPLHQQALAWGVSKKVKLVQRPDNQVLLYWATKQE